MKKQQYIESLINVSHAIGNNPAYMQGGGGNTSVKINQNLMLIKSSGTNLKEMSETQGQNTVDFIKINSFLNERQVDEESFTKKINSFSQSKTDRPSIETGFHSILGKFVIHTHSVFVNVFLCSKQGREIIKELFPDSLWINYWSPGKNLTLAIKKELEREKLRFSGEKIIFLQNHGLIVSSHGGEQALELHEYINDKFKTSFDLAEFKVVSSCDKKIENALFPDQVVYLGEKNYSLSQAAKETLSAYYYIEQEMSNLNLSPNYLSKTDINKITHMESEKFRKSLVK